MNTQEIFSILSEESKSLKSAGSFKSGQEGLLKAFYFFRWCNKSEYLTTEKIADGFARGKIPEQQAEHYGTALVMIDNYETDPRVKEALREIDRLTAVRDGGKGVLDRLEPAKVERRVLKNIHANLSESIQAVKGREAMLKKTAAATWAGAAAILIISLGLLFSGTYQNLITSLLHPPAGTFWASQGALAVAAALFALPVLALFLVNRGKIAEHMQKAGNYPQDAKKMEETLSAFSKRLADKKIPISTETE
jgi:hypothetical protein